MKRASFVKRFVALVLAAAIVLPNVNWSAFRVSAAEGEKTITAAELVAKNYELTEAEANLLNSGIFVGETYTYTVPSNATGELVVVDPDNHLITAGKFGNWVPVSAEIIAGGATQESGITFADEDADGIYTATYEYDGKMFYADVVYDLDMDVDAGVQENLMASMVYLNNATKDVADVYEQDANLGVIASAVPALERMIEGFTFEIAPGREITEKLSDTAAEAVRELRKQLNANDGKLDLQVSLEEYIAGKSAYLVAFGDEFKEEIKATYDLLKIIADDDQIGNINIPDYLEAWDMAAEAVQWEAMVSILNQLISALKPVAEAEWGSFTPAVLVKDADYAKLDTLVAALTTNTAIEAKATLDADTVVLQANASMYDVEVNVVLKTVEKEDANTLVDNKIGPTTVTLGKDASLSEVEDAIKAEDIENKAIKEWTDKGLYTEAKDKDGYTRTVETDLSSDGLTDNCAYTIVYTPKQYEVTYGYTPEEGEIAPEKVNYGYKMTLPKHADDEKAYDYTVNGEKQAQGTVITITKATEIKRVEGKAYTAKTLYGIIADNVSSDKVASAILASGALFNDKAVNVRVPDARDVEELLKLEGGQLEAADYDSNYEGLKWEPDTYGTTGTEESFGTQDIVAWTANAVTVKYKLSLTNVTNAQEIIDLAIDLDQDAEGQTATLDRLASYYDLMGQLDKTKLGAMNGVIDVQDEIDAATKAEMKATINKIINGHLDGQQLKLYNMIGEYLNEQGGGLYYYYTNSNKVLDEINTLSSYITELLDNKDALTIVANAAGYGEYVDKIADIDTALADVKRDLKAPNAAIDLSSANLGKLVAALEMEGSVSADLKLETPYIVSSGLKATDSSYKVINVMIQVGNKSRTVSSDEILRGTAIDQAVIDGLEAQILAELSDMEIDAKYYERALGEGSDTVAAGDVLDKNLNVVYVYTPVAYTVKIEGEADQTITVENLQISLPKHSETGYRYDYTVDGKVVNSAIYNFEVAQLDKLFVDGVYTITRVAVNVAAEKLENKVNDFNSNGSGNFYELVKDTDGNITGFVATVKGDKNGIMSFVEDLVNSGYDYIGLNDEALMYLNAENTLEVSMQTMINALLADTTFGSQTLIDLGTNNGGKVLSAKLDLGSTNAASAKMRSINATLDFDNLDFVLKLDGVPVKMLKVSNGLDAIKNYMSFQSAGDSMDVTLNLPEKVYEAYLTALLATGELDKTDVNAIDNKIAFEFLYDYIEQVIENEDVTATTFENTLKKLDNAVNKWTEYDVPDYNLSAYDEYYQMLREALMGKNVTIDAQPENCTFDFIGQGQGILKMLDVMGIVIPENYETYIGMIKELKDGETLEATVKANLANTSRDFEAALIDVRNDRFVDKADFTNDLPARLNEVTGAAVIVLLDDVDGDLTFNATTVLDLNGKTVNGSITSNKNLIIVDSSLNNDNAGKVTGAISGTATIIGGYYDDPSAEAFVKDGYKIVNKQVQNVLYTLSTDANGGLAFDINSDILEENIDRYTVFAAELAADVAVDLVANYYTTAALNVLVDDETNQDTGFVAGWKMIYGFNFSDFVDLIQSDSIPTDLVNMGLDMVSLPDLACVANMITADLLDLDAIKAALNSNGTQAIASYSAQIAPWMVKVDHIFENGEDYLTFGITGNEDLAKSIQISLYINGDNYTDEAVKVIEYLDKIIVEENEETFFRLVDVEELTYADKHFNLAGGAKARVHLDLSDYTTAMAVIMAHGNPAKEADIIAAIGNEAALKAIFDEFTVEEVFNAVKVLNRNDSLADIAKGYGIDMEPNKYLEKALILSLSATGKVLERLEITGNEAKLGSLDQDGDGIYEYGPKSVSKSGSVTKRGYGVNLDLTTAEATVIIDLFGEDCLWGDMDHDNDVDNYDATLVLQYYAKLIPVENICEKKADVNDDGAIDNYDATLILQHYAKLISKFPVEE